jgi:carnitine O-acetyltransferase
MEVHKMLGQIYRRANERPAPWVDHASNLGNPRTRMKMAGAKGSNEAESEDEDEEEIAGYSFIDSVGS